MDRSSNPVGNSAEAPPPARRWSWSLEPDAPIDAGGDEWWASLRPLPLDPERPLHPAPDSAALPCSSAPPPALITEVLDSPVPSRPWLMPALGMAAALVVALGGAASESAADSLGQAAA